MIRSWKDLLAYLDRHELPAVPEPSAKTLGNYQMGVTPYTLSLIQQWNETDPIFRQVIPSDMELTILPEEREDPIGDEAPMQGKRVGPAVIHRYPDRVLLLTTSLCSVHCRYCFRKRLVGQPDQAATSTELAEGIAYIAAKRQIREVILTGGDPLTLSDRRLLDLLHQLDAIPHIQLLRIHTRLASVNPFRLTAELGQAVRQLETPVWVVTHFNHVRELTPVAAQWTANWIDQGIPFLNQAVLLQGVNDSTAALEDLFLGLLRQRIKPYYLHQADLVKGTSHLRVPVQRGLDLLKELQGKIPGHALPHYILDRPGGAGKIPLQNNYLDP